MTFSRCYCCIQFASALVSGCLILCFELKLSFASVDWLMYEYVTTVLNGDMTVQKLYEDYVSAQINEINVEVS